MLSSIIFLGLVNLAFGAPLAEGSGDIHSLAMNPAAQYGTGGGILGFIVLVLDIIVWIEVLKSPRPALHKLLWCLLVFIFPIVGVILYYLFSDRKKWNESGYEVLP